jgi:hypothetical protein
MLFVGSAVHLLDNPSKICHANYMSKNTRPLISPADLKILKFALGSIRDDRARLLDECDRNSRPTWETRYEEVETLFSRLLGKEYA